MAGSHPGLPNPPRLPPTTADHEPGSPGEEVRTARREAPARGAGLGGGKSVTRWTCTSPHHFAHRRPPPPAPRPQPRPLPALTLQAAGRRPQHPQQYLPPAEEPHSAGQRAGGTTTEAQKEPAHGDASRAPSQRKTGRRQSRSAGAAPRRHLGCWQPPRAPSWSRADCLWPDTLRCSFRVLLLAQRQVFQIMFNFPDTLNLGRSSSQEP